MTYPLRLLLMAGLISLTCSACAPQQPEQSAETSQRIAVCEDVMRLYIQEAKTYERDRQKLIASCQISQKERSLAQWQCVLDAQKQGRKYAEASDQCGRTATK